ncbi:putative DNA-binding protein [Gillisia sp. Hel_I_86]|uniref:AlbA family DNA-binding domain-containing protein n=1 Tax=Gillisia sp. Hel_I_86 TaxID=1249981 RepID=UPI00119A28A1|nr:ATP-binding protein [Gillisia sp. Hel_I_86]TVZ28699.1 putative DNA-binding protein [Gillisia sp. Hel_I_86]
MAFKKGTQDLNVILIHLIIGSGIFYFLVHPFTMVLYGFELSNTPFSFPVFWETLRPRLLESFSFHMAGMGGLMTILGALLGLVVGLFWINIKEKERVIHSQERLLKQDILKLVEMGEHEWVEFKSTMRYDTFKKNTNRALEVVIAKTIAGFMNAKGGRLIIGVDDDGNILGLENDFKTLKHKNKDGLEREIFRIIRDYLGREACFKSQVSFYELEGKEICLVDAEASPGPVYVTDGKITTFYVRTGNATYPLSVEETVNYLKIPKP